MDTVWTYTSHDTVQKCFHILQLGKDIFFTALCILLQQRFRNLKRVQAQIRIRKIKILTAESLGDSLHLILRINQENIICTVNQCLSDFRNFQQHGFSRTSVAKNNAIAIFQCLSVSNDRISGFFIDTIPCSARLDQIPGIEWLECQIRTCQDGTHIIYTPRSDRKQRIQCLDLLIVVRNNLYGMFPAAASDFCRVCIQFLFICSTHCQQDSYIEAIFIIFLDLIHIFFQIGLLLFLCIGRLTIEVTHTCIGLYFLPDRILIVKIRVADFST